MLVLVFSQLCSTHVDQSAVIYAPNVSPPAKQEGKPGHCEKSDKRRLAEA